VRFAGVSLDITERKEAEERLEILVLELDHRAKNLLAVVQAILRLSKAESTGEYVDAVMGRISALSTAHSLLSASRWQGVELGRIVEQEMTPFVDGEASRAHWDGPPVSLSSAAAQPLAVTLHELATNASKYGALSQHGGIVRVTWELHPAVLVLHWLERGGPSVAKPSQTGFGLKAITGSIESQLNGRVEFVWAPEGLQVTLEIPRNRVLPHPANSVSRPDGQPAEPADLAPSNNNRILIVEDDGLIGAMLKKVLCDLGCEVVGPISDLNEAVWTSKQADVAGAFLDIDLDGASVYPVADALVDRRLPFVFVTGYSLSGIDRRFAYVPVLEKPVDIRRVRQLLADYIFAAAPEASRLSAMAI
jgi:two-component sensor histidine kinase